MQNISDYCPVKSQQKPEKGIHVNTSTFACVNNIVHPSPLK